MRNALFILGALLVAAGILVATGLFKYEDTDTAEFGKLEIQTKSEKTMPLNWGYLLLGGGALVLVGAALAKKP